MFKLSDAGIHNKSMGDKNWHEYMDYKERRIKESKKWRHEKQGQIVQKTAIDREICKQTERQSDRKQIFCFVLSALEIGSNWKVWHDSRSD